MSYKHFGRLAGTTHTAKQALLEMAPPNTLTPFNAQAPATKFLAYGEDATSLTFNRALGALSANTDYLAAILNGPALRNEIIEPSRVKLSGIEGFVRSGHTSLSSTEITSNNEQRLHLGTTGSTGWTTPIYWVYLGLHKNRLSEHVGFYQSQAQSILPDGTGHDPTLDYVGPQNASITQVSTPSTVHEAYPENAYVNQVASAGNQSYFDPLYKLAGIQEYIGKEAHGVAIHVPPVERMKPGVAPYGGDWTTADIYKWDTDGVYLKDTTFAELLLRQGCFVEISGDGDEHVNQGNNGLFQIVDIVRSDHTPGTGGSGDKAILSRGGLCRVTVKDWRVFGRGELVSWASAPNHKDDIEDTALWPGLRRNYAHVAYIIPRPDQLGQEGEVRGDLYLAVHSSEDDFPQAIIGSGDPVANKGGGKAGVPQVTTVSRYLGRYRHGGIGSPDQERPVTDANGVIIMDAQQNHGLVPGTRLYHGHAHFYPSGSPWGLDPNFAMAYSEILGGPSAPHSIVGPGEPVAFNPKAVPGKVWPCSPPGFVINPSFSFRDSNRLYGGEYFGKVKTLSTVKEMLIPTTATPEGEWGNGLSDPKEKLLDSWFRFLRHGYLHPNNAKLGDSTGHHGDNDMQGIGSPKSDDLNRWAAPTKKILGGELWEVEVTQVTALGYNTLEEAVQAHGEAGNAPFVGDLATIAGGAGASQTTFSHPKNVGHNVLARIVSVKGNRMVLTQVHWETKQDYEEYPLYNGWSTGRNNWPITDEATGGSKSRFSFAPPLGATTWEVSNILKAPWLDDKWGRGMIAGYGLNAAYNNDYASNPVLRGDVSSTEGVNSGSGGTLYINPARPFTTVLPGGGTNLHPGGWGDYSAGEIAHHTRTNNDVYAVLHRATRRDSNNITTELSFRLGHAHAHTLGWELIGGHWVPKWVAETGNMANNYVYSENAVTVGGPESSRRMLLVDETTGTYGVTSEIGDWSVKAPEIGKTGENPAEGTSYAWNRYEDYMGATRGEGESDPETTYRHGVFLSNNLSKVRRDAVDGTYAGQPAFDSRSTPQEVQDRSILGSIEGTLLGNFTSAANHLSGDYSGLNDIDNFGALSNGVLKGAKAWASTHSGHTGYPTHGIGRANISESFGPLTDKQFYLSEAYFLVGGAKWYVPEVVLGGQTNDEGTWLVVWNADTRRYHSHALFGKGSGWAMRYKYKEHSIDSSLDGNFPVWDAAHEMPLWVIDVDDDGDIQKVTDVRKRVHRQDAKTSIYVGDAYLEHHGISARSNGGYIGDSMNFSTLGEAFAALKFWSKGGSSRNWTIEVVGPTVEGNGEYTRGSEHPIRMPCDGITVRGLHGRIQDTATTTGHRSGWDIAAKDGGQTSLIQWGDPDYRYLRGGLFDLNGRYGITFENLSFKCLANLDRQFVPGYMVNGLSVQYADYDSEGISTDNGEETGYQGNRGDRASIMDCLFVAGNKAYADGEITNHSNALRNDRESWDYLYGYTQMGGSNQAYSGRWVFDNIDLEGGGGFLTTLAAWYSIDNVTVRNCSARGTLSFVTVGMDSYTQGQSGFTGLNGWSQPGENGKANGKYHRGFVIENNTATFPSIQSYRNGGPTLELACDLEHWVPKTDLMVGGSPKDWEGTPGVVDGDIARYRCAVFAERTKDIQVIGNQFSGFYAGVVFSKPLSPLASEHIAVGYNKAQYCTGSIDKNRIERTQSHGIFVMSNSQTPYLSITNNSVIDPGFPYGASEQNSNRVNIFDYEAFCIKICANRVVCTGNQLRNAFRSSSLWGANGVGIPAGMQRVDKTGQQPLDPTTGRDNARAGGIFLTAAKQFSLADPELVSTTDYSDISNNDIHLSGKALIGILVGEWVHSPHINENSITMTHSAQNRLDEPNYGHSSFTNNTGKYPWALFMGDGCSSTHMRGNRFGGNVFVGEESDNTIFTDNTVRTQWGNGRPSLVWMMSQACNISNNKIDMGSIVLGGTGTRCHHGKIVNNDLSPIGPDMNTRDAVPGLGIFVGGYGSGLLVSGNTTYGGTIQFSGSGYWHDSKIINNITGSISPTRPGHYITLGTSSRDIPGGNIDIWAGDGLVVSGNSTLGGHIRLGHINQNSGKQGSYGSVISDNKLFGGNIEVWGWKPTITGNDCSRFMEDKDYSVTGYSKNKARIKLTNCHEAHVANNKVIGTIDITGSESGVLQGNIGWYGATIEGSRNWNVQGNSFICPANYTDICGTNGKIKITNSWYCSVKDNTLLRPRYGDSWNWAHEYGLKSTKGYGGAGVKVIAPDQKYEQTIDGGVVYWIPSVDGNDSKNLADGEWGSGFGNPPVLWNPDFAYLDSGAGAIAGMIILKNALHAEISGNFVTQVLVQEGAKGMRISNNTCIWGGANPAVYLNSGILVKKGNHDGLQVLNNRVYGNIHTMAHEDTNLYRKAMGIQVLGNRVGTVLSGDHHVSTSYPTNSYQSDTTGDGQGDTELPINTQERAWRGGGGYIIIDECGGAMICSNSTLTWQGTIPDYGVNNIFDGREWGRIVLNRNGDWVMRIHPGTGNDPLYSVCWQNTTFWAAQNLTGALFHNGEHDNWYGNETNENFPGPPRGSDNNPSMHNGAMNTYWYRNQNMHGIHGGGQGEIYVGVYGNCMSNALPETLSGLGDDIENLLETNQISTSPIGLGNAFKA